jgi:hypothetical protein
MNESCYYHLKSDCCTYLRGVRLVQVLVQLLVVVDLSINSQHDSAIMASQRLCSALRVNDSKPLVCNAVLAIANDAVARPVRPSVPQSGGYECRNNAEQM